MRSPGGYPAYDVMNRLVAVGTGYAQYSYAPSNKRVWRGIWTSSTLTTDEVTFWSISGQKLATYSMQLIGGLINSSSATPQLVASQATTNYYFGRKLIKNGNSPVGYVGSDRLGSIGKYYPYGQEKPSATTNGTEKFTGYMRDAETGLDYAVNRYHNPGTGRFLTVDPKATSAQPNSPGSWNRYSYVIGDPVNGVDPNGLEYEGTGNNVDENEDPADNFCSDCEEDGGGGEGDICGPGQVWSGPAQTCYTPATSLNAQDYDSDGNPIAGQDLTPANVDVTGSTTTVDLNGNPTQGDIPISGFARAVLGQAGRNAAPVANPCGVAGFYVISAAPGAVAATNSTAVVVQLQTITILGRSLPVGPALRWLQNMRVSSVVGVGKRIGQVIDATQSACNKMH